MALSETHLIGNGMTKYGEHSLYFSGRNDNVHREGVGFLLSKRARNALVEWKPINSRLAKARFGSRQGTITMIVCYSPIEADTENEKDVFYDRLQEEVTLTQKHDILIIVGDFNAKIGCNNTGFENIMGRFSSGLRNGNGTRLVQMCSNNNLIIGGSLFKHKKIHLDTWISPGGTFANQIDHFCLRRLSRHSLEDV